MILVNMRLIDDSTVDDGGNKGRELRGGATRWGRV